MAFSSDYFPSIEHVICLPVPEKSQRQFNFCIIPRYGDGISPAPEGQAALEPMVWTVADGTPKSAYNGAGQQFGDREKTEALIRRVLNESLHPIKVVRPGDKEFVSAMPEAHRKGEKAYHVKAFRGSKEGDFSTSYAISHSRAGILTSTRLSVLPVHGNIFRLQEAAALLCV